MEEPHDSLGRLRVKTRSGLVQGQKKLYYRQRSAWVSDKRTNFSSSTPTIVRLPNCGTKRSKVDDGITIVLKTTHLQTLVNAERTSITPKPCDGEGDRLANGVETKEGTRVPRDTPDVSERELGTTERNERGNTHWLMMWCSDPCFSKNTSPDAQHTPTRPTSSIQ
jgi:hypothetical protein